MPLNRAALRATDKLRREQVKNAETGEPAAGVYLFPDLAEDEYIEILHVRDFPRDQQADMRAQREQPPIPRVKETPAQTARREPTVRRDDELYWRAVWEYMCVRLHVRDADTGVWMDGGDEGTSEQHRGTQQDRDDIWSAWGPYLTPALQARFGSIAPLIKDGEVNANGKPLTFRGPGGLQPPASAEVGESGGTGAHRTRARA